MSIDWNKIRSGGSLQTKSKIDWDKIRINLPTKTITPTLKTTPVDVRTLEAKDIMNGMIQSGQAVTSTPNIIQPEIKQGVMANLPAAIKDTLVSFGKGILNLPKKITESAKNQSKSFTTPLGLQTGITEDTLQADAPKDRLATAGVLAGLAFPSKGIGMISEGIPGARGLSSLLSKGKKLDPLSQKATKGVGVIKETDEDVIKKITIALKEAKPLRGAQEEIYTKERGLKLAKSLGVRQNVGKTEAGFHAELSALKGEMGKVNFESVRKEFNQDNIDRLFKIAVDSPYVTEWEKISARTGLTKILDGKLPTEGELGLLRDIYGDDLVKAMTDKKSLFEKLKNAAYELVNIPRAIMTSFDFSFPFRQGIFTAFRHPKIFASEFGSMFKSAFSEKAYVDILKSIKERPTYLKMRESKLPLTDVNSILTGREEVFMSSWAEKIPLFGNIIRGSNRAYTTFANKLRADLFDDFVKLGKKVGVENEKVYLRSAADFIGNATGRGSLGRLSGAAKVLNTLFFSPRLMASRINLMRPDKYVKMHPTVRKEALKSLFAFLGGGMTILGLAKLAGKDDVEISTAPNSADFGKIKIQDTRMDIWGGFQQYIKLAAQLMSGKIVSSTTGNITLLGEGYRPLNRLDIVENFFKSKEAPMTSFVTSWLSGETFLGEDFELKKEVTNRFVPMVIQDAADMVKIGDLELLPLQIPAVFGVGTQTYFDKATRAKEDLDNLSKEKAAKEFDRLIKKDPKMAEKVNDLIEAEKIGFTPTDSMLKKLGVENGKRAEYIVKELNKLKTKEEKAEYYQSLIDKRIINKDVSNQLFQLLK